MAVSACSSAPPLISQEPIADIRLIQEQLDMEREKRVALESDLQQHVLVTKELMSALTSSRAVCLCVYVCMCMFSFIW